MSSRCVFSFLVAVALGVGAWVAPVSVARASSGITAHGRRHKHKRPARPHNGKRGGGPKKDSASSSGLKL